jgi:hypothetical protein
VSEITYTLSIFGKGDSLIIELPLTEEQAEAIGEAIGDDLSSGCCEVPGVFLHVWQTVQ